MIYTLKIIVYIFSWRINLNNSFNNLIIGFGKVEI